MENKNNIQVKIINMFNNIAPKYNLVNKIISFNLDKKWRKKSCEATFNILNKDNLHQIVDVACGTGDLLNEWKSTAENRNIKVNKYVGVDPSVEMIKIAKKDINFAEFLENGANKINLDDSSSDIISISYGIRNVVEIDGAIKEFSRILNKDGLLVILEFTKNDKKTILSKFINIYLNYILPFIGGFLSRNMKAYKYLSDSINNFLTTEELIKKLEENKFEIIEVKNFSFKISTLIIARNHQK